MTITDAPRTETVAPPPAPLGWTGKYKACKDCGTRDRPEVEDGLCTTCYADRFGPAARRMAEARRDSRRPAAPVVEASAPPERWHPEFDACLDCGTTENPYGSRGLCRKCYPATLKPGYTGNAAPPKPPGGRGVSTPRPGPPPNLTGALPRDETSLAAVETTVARHMAQLPAKPTPAPISAPLTPAQVAEVWIAPLPEADGDEDLPEFEEFTEAVGADQLRPMMSLRQDGALTLNRAALALIGAPGRVVILVARDRRILAVRAAREGEAHARMLGAERKGHRRTVRVSAALRHYGLGTASPGRYDVRQYGDAVGIALRFDA